MEPVNESSVATDELERGATHFRRKRLAEAAGGEELGASLYELPVGARSWPYHYHTGNEEALYVLSGDGTLRTGGENGEEHHSLTAGDYVALPAGTSGGHRVVNDGDEPLRYLALSTMRDPDVTVYPDSGKVGVFAGSPPGGSGERTVHGYFRADDTVDYWTDEE